MQCTQCRLLVCGEAARISGGGRGTTSGAEKQNKFVLASGGRDAREQVGQPLSSYLVKHPATRSRQLPKGIG
jgi:hypothetical protein